MSRNSTGLAVAIGAAIAIGAVVAFASGKKKTQAGDEDDFDDATDTPVSPVVPSSTPPVTPLGTPPFVPPGIITVSNPGTTPPVGPPIVSPPVVLPDDDDEADLPTVVVPPLTIPGTVQIPGTGIQVPIPPIPGVTAPPVAVPLPPPIAVEQPSLVPADTARVVALMLSEEGTPNWKRKYPELGAWQAARGRTVDQMFGPGDALAMAQEIGTLPIIRFWPRGTLPQTALEPYRNQLLTISATAPEPRRAQLVMAASREQGQGFGSTTRPVQTLINLNAASVPA